MFRSYVSFREGICISMVEYVQYVYICYICGNWYEYSRFVFAQISERILVSKLYRRNMTQAFRILQLYQKPTFFQAKSEMQVDDTNNVNYIMSFGLPSSTKSKVIHRSSIFCEYSSHNLTPTSTFGTGN